MAFVYFFLSLFFFFLIKQKEKTILTPLIVVIITWCVFPAINSLHPCGIYPLSDKTHFCILLSLFSFVIVYYSFLKTKKSSIHYNSDDAENKTVRIKLLIFLNGLVAIWLGSKLPQALANLSLFGWVMQRSAETRTDIFGGTIEQVLYGVFAQPIVFASIAILSVMIFKKKKINIVFLSLLILNVVQDVIIFAARATLVKIVIYIVISYFFLQKKHTSKQIFKFSLILAVLFVAIAMITGERNVGTDWGIGETMVVYYIAPFNVLDYYFQHPEHSLISMDQWTFGTCITGGLYNFIPMAFYVLFKTPYFGTDDVITQVTALNVEVGPNMGMNAACTAVYPFYKDFGYLGIIIGFALMARLLVYIKNCYEREASVRHGAIYVFFIYEIFRLSVFYDFLFPSYVMTIFVILFVTKQSKLKKAI